MRRIREELIPVSSSPWEKKKLEHIFQTVRLKKLKPVATPRTGLIAKI